MSSNQKRDKIVTAILLLIACVITLLHFTFDSVRVFGMSTSIFYLDERITFGSFFTTTLAFLNGFLVYYLIVSNLTEHKFWWQCIGVFFFLLSLDEFFELHEAVNTFVGTHVADGSLINQSARYSWILPLSIVIAAIFVAFLVLIFKEKDRFVRFSFALGLACYAVIITLELIGSATYGLWYYKHFVGIGEGLEMLSAVIFLQAILSKSSHLIGQS